MKLRLVLLLILLLAAASGFGLALKQQHATGNERAVAAYTTTPNQLASEPTAFAPFLNALREAIHLGMVGDEDLTFFQFIGFGTSWEEILQRLSNSVGRGPEGSVDQIRKLVEGGELPPEPPVEFRGLGKTWEEIFQALTHRGIILTID